MNKELEITKEKLNTLEQAWENICVTGRNLIMGSECHAWIIVCKSHLQFNLFFTDLCFLFTLPGENSKANADKVLANNEILSVSKRITTLELKELNERQRAEHAQKMYEQMRNSLRQVEERNTELESKIAEVWLLSKTADNWCNHHFQFSVENMFNKDDRPGIWRTLCSKNQSHFHSTDAECHVPDV